MSFELEQAGSIPHKTDLGTDWTGLHNRPVVLIVEDHEDSLISIN
jgi:hypothetical protein